MGTNARWSAQQDLAVAGLLAEVSTDVFGSVSPSIYETARLAASAPWLPGQAERLRFLCRAQRSDGFWGAPDGYDLVPTLSAVEALLTVLADPDQVTDPLLTAANQGLHGLFARQELPALVPDTIGFEVLIPWLIKEINQHLDRLATAPLPGLDLPSGRLELPPGVDDSTYLGLTALVHSGQPLPPKVWHCLEFLGEAAEGLDFVTPVGGVVCGSPAATVAWLGARGGAEFSPERQFLHELLERHGGVVPGVAPIAVFERAWVVSALSDAGIATEVPASVAPSLLASFGEWGAPAGLSIPADSDDTAAALYALSRLGRPGPVDSLWRYEQPEYFWCFPNERTPSTSTNAHILDALSEYADLPGPHRHRCPAAKAKIARYLLDNQEPDGSWWDKWHASPYYATAACALALLRSGQPEIGPALDRAVDWVLATQRADGSWGRWAGTVEETAYAVQILLYSGSAEGNPAVAAAARRGGDHLQAAGDAGPFAPLWHDKDLYSPVAVIRAARLAALRLIADHAEQPARVPAAGQ